MTGQAERKAGVEAVLHINGRQSPIVRISDIWKAPLHDLPVRDELLYQYLPISSGMKLLEIGPGSGLTAFRLSREAGHITLLDVAPGNVERLRRDLGSLPNVSFVCADACAPDLPAIVGTGYDAVAGLEVFEYIPDPGACLRNLAQVLKPGGCLLLQWPNYPPERAGGVTWFPTRQEIDVLMEAAGFSAWSLYSLRLNAYAGAVFRIFHEAPLRCYRRTRKNTAATKPQTFDETWAFRSGSQLAPYQCVLHSFWMLLSALMRAGGDCFRRTPVTGTDLRRNLLLIGLR